MAAAALVGADVDMEIDEAPGAAAPPAHPLAAESRLADAAPPSQADPSHSQAAGAGGDLPSVEPASGLPSQTEPQPPAEAARRNAEGGDRTRSSKGGRSKGKSKGDGKQRDRERDGKKSARDKDRDKDSKRKRAKTEGACSCARACAWSRPVHPRSLLSGDADGKAADGKAKFIPTLDGSAPVRAKPQSQFLCTVRARIWMSHSCRTE
jgi:hypothetical protein